MKRVNSFTELR